MLLALANLLRFWVIATLGAHWNVRVVRSMPFGVVTGRALPLRPPPELRRGLRRAGWRCRWSTAPTSPRPSGRALHVLILRRRIALEESVLMTDPTTGSAFAAKPRFLPWPMS